MRGFPLRLDGPREKAFLYIYFSVADAPWQGKLPWQGLTAKTREAHMEKIRASKAEEVRNVKTFGTLLGRRRYMGRR